MADGLTALWAGRRLYGRAGVLALKRPAPDQLLGWVLVVGATLARSEAKSRGPRRAASRCEEFAYHALVRLAQIRTSGENRLNFGSVARLSSVRQDRPGCRAAAWSEKAFPRKSGKLRLKLNCEIAARNEKILFCPAAKLRIRPCTFLQRWRRLRPRRATKIRLEGGAGRRKFSFIAA